LSHCTCIAKMPPSKPSAPSKIISLSAFAAQTRTSQYTFGTDSCHKPSYPSIFSKAHTSTLACWPGHSSMMHLILTTLPSHHWASTSSFMRSPVSSKPGHHMALLGGTWDWPCIHTAATLYGSWKHACNTSVTHSPGCQPSAPCQQPCPLNSSWQGSPTSPWHYKTHLPTPC